MVFSVTCGGFTAVGALSGPSLLSLKGYAVGVVWMEVIAVAKQNIQDDLADLHAGLAILLKEKLQEGTITASEMNILRQFLKDNSISAQPTEGTPFGELVSNLPDLDKVVHMPRRRTA